MNFEQVGTAWSYLSKAFYQLSSSYQQAGIFYYFDQHDITQIREILSEDVVDQIQVIGKITLPCPITLISAVGVTCLFHLSSAVFILILTYYDKIFKQLRFRIITCLPWSQSNGHSSVIFVQSEFLQKQNQF